jgi:hypothetical protein
MPKSFRCRLPRVLSVLVGGVLLSGCGGEEKIALKKVDFVLDTPKDFKETRKAFVGGKGSSKNIGHDPSGVSKE